MVDTAQNGNFDQKNDEQGDLGVHHCRTDSRGYST